MTDQPRDHDTDQADQETTDHGRSNQPPTDQLTTPEPVPIEEAAAALGITINAVRQRLKRGTLTGIKTDTCWLVDVLPTTRRPTSDQRPADRPTTATNQRLTTTDHPTAVDLAPLTELIDRQGRELRQLAEAAAVWQVRALQAEERLKQLTAGAVADAGEDAPQTRHSGPGEESAGVVADETGAPWWRRWWRLLRTGT